MQNFTLSQTIAGAVILLAVISAIVALAWHSTLTGTEAITALTTIIALGGGALAVHTGAKTASRALNDHVAALNGTALIASENSGPPRD